MSLPRCAEQILGPRLLDVRRRGRLADGPLADQNAVRKANSWSHGETVDCAENRLVKIRDNVEESALNVDGSDNAKAETWNEDVGRSEDVQRLRFQAGTDSVWKSPK